MRTRTRITLAGLMIGASLAGGVAWATIPSADGTIHGCYKHGNGDLRVVDNAGDCTKSELAISWNEQGIAGAVGPAGPRGVTGAAGTNGTDGTNGATGAVGATGPAGPQGAKGDTGAAGTNGTNGTNGAAGAKGDPCLSSDPACVGPQGAQGDPGTNGTNGTNGATGATGAQGPPGTGATVLWARVNADGSLASGSGVVSTYKTADGLYDDYFNRDVTNCAIVASALHPSNANGVSIDVENDAIHPTNIQFEIFRGYNILGQPSRLNADFSVVITC